MSHLQEGRTDTVMFKRPLEFKSVSLAGGKFKTCIEINNFLYCLSEFMTYFSHHISYRVCFLGPNLTSGFSFLIGGNSTTGILI